MKIPLCLIISGILLTIAVSCKKTLTVDEVLASHHGGMTSHHNGLACIQCHANGSEAPAWAVAGSVYKKNSDSISSDGTIFLYSGPGGSAYLIGTNEVDGKGNFFTSASLMPAGGAYPQIKGKSGDIQNMLTTTNSGNCNLCHGNTAPRIWVN